MEVAVEEVSQKDALGFWERSPHATAFTNPLLGSYFSKSLRWFLAIKGSTPYVLWPISDDPQGGLRIPSHTYYFGPMWSDVAWNKSITSRMSDAQLCYGKLVEHILTLDNQFEFELHPGIIDVRFFLWWNYGMPAKPKFVVEPRYSAVIHNLQEKNEAELLAQMRKWRRIEVKRATKTLRYSLIDSLHPKTLLELRERTFALQGVTENKPEVMQLGDLEALMMEPSTTVTAVIDDHSGDVVAANLVIDGAGSSNLIFSHLSGSHRAEGVGPLATFNAITRARERGMNMFDFNGANSPNRGDDKHSYGAVPELFFRLRFPG